MDQRSRISGRVKYDFSISIRTPDSHVRLFRVCSNRLTGPHQSCFILFHPHTLGENMTEQHTLADRLRARAQQLGLTPAHVAEMAGVHRSFVYDILRGLSISLQD